MQLMRDIYTNARRTIVWLGSAEADSDLAMQFLKDMEVCPNPHEAIAAMLRERPDDPLYDALKHLYHKRPYWGRLWVIQEVACASEVIVGCGGLSISLTSFRNMSTILNRVLMSLPFDDSMQQHMRLANTIMMTGPSRLAPTAFARGLTEAWKPVPLLELLSRHQNAECTDPRDRFFALLGLSSLENTTHPGLRLD